MSAFLIIYYEGRKRTICGYDVVTSGFETVETLQAEHKAKAKGNSSKVKHMNTK